MSIRSSQYFIYDGISSDTFGIKNVNVSSGMLDEPFLASRHINEVKIRGRDKPYFSGVTHDPLQFTLSFAFDDSFDNDKIRAVARWLSVEYYKPLQFSDNLDRVYYAMIDSDSHLIHNALSQGYITLSFRCNSPYSYSEYIMSPVYDLSNNSNIGTTIQLKNLGDISINPEVYIQKIGTGSVSIVNNTNSGSAMNFAVGLVNNENIYIDCANEIIISDQVPTTYRYNLHNNIFLECVYGVNNLQVFGNIKLRFRYQYIYLQG